MGMNLQKGQRIARGNRVVTVPALHWVENGVEHVEKFATSSKRLGRLNELEAREGVSNVRCDWVRK
jgi:hypothetical protein